MKAEPLEFPRGVRFARQGEMPAGNEEAFARIASARITTGFVRKKSSKAGYSDLFEANVHASRIWDVFRDLVEAIVPAGAAPIVGVKDDDPMYGPYTTREAALNVLQQFKEQLQHDGYLEFGIIYQRQGHTEEVFVRSAKYMQIWSSKPSAVVDVLSKHGLPEVPDLQFLDDYPRITEALSVDGQTWDMVIEALHERFATLPDRPEVAGD